MSSYDLLPKLFVLNGTVKTTGTSANLTAGDFGLYDPITHAVITTGNAASHPKAYVAQGSYYVSDRIGNLHGGYKESIKSPAFTKGIDPRLVKKWYKSVPRPTVNQIVRLFWNGTDAGNFPVFTCGKTYYLRLEVKGEPVLRFTDRYLYKQFGSFTGCCADDCTAPCTDSPVDAASVMFDYANQINNDPLIGQFVQASPVVEVASTTATYSSAGTTLTVASATNIAVGQTATAAGVNGKVTAISGTTITIDTPATAAGSAVPVAFSKVVDNTYVSPTLPSDKALVKAGLVVSVIYTPTVFADCSFNQSDYYNNEFVEVLASMVYQNGDVCQGGEVQMNSITGQNFYEIRPFQIPNGSGEVILRDFIASQEQSGIYFSQNPRDRETTFNIALSTVNRSSFYNRYYLLYSLPQTGNPSNVLSHDQYLLSFALEQTISVTAFEALMLAWLQASNPSIVLETIV